MVCEAANLGSLATNAAGQLDILGHDGHPLGMDGADVGVLKQPHEIGLAGLLKSHHSRALEAKVSLEILGNLSHQSLEGHLAKEQLRGLLVPPDLPQGHGAGPVPVRLLDTAGGRGTLPGGLGSQLLPRSLPSSRLAGGLLGPSHDSGRWSTDSQLQYQHSFIAPVSNPVSRASAWAASYWPARYAGRRATYWLAEGINTAAHSLTGHSSFNS